VKKGEIQYRRTSYCATFEVKTALPLKIQVFWDVTPCGWLNTVQKDIVLCDIWGENSVAAEDPSLLGCYALWLVKYLPDSPTFRRMALPTFSGWSSRGSNRHSSVWPWRWTYDGPLQRRGTIYPTTKRNTPEDVNVPRIAMFGFFRGSFVSAPYTPMYFTP
jgi:hypothetical protein